MLIPLASCGNDPSRNGTSHSKKSGPTTFKEMKRKFEGLEKLVKENSMLNAVVQQLSKKIDTSEKQILSQNVEIYGVPEKNRDDLWEIAGET